MRGTFLLYLFAWLVLLTHGNFCYAQNSSSSQVDSMLRLLPRKAADTHKVKLLQSLATAYLEIDPNKGVQYGRLAENLAKQLGWKKGVVGACRIIGLNYEYLYEYDSALSAYEEVLSMQIALKDKMGIGKAYFNLGIVCLEQNDYAKAIAYNQKAIEVFQKIGEKKYLSSVYGNLGVVYKSISNYPVALDYYFKSLKMDEERGDTASMAINLGNIGQIYNVIDNHEKSLQYYFKSIELKKSIGEKRGIAIFMVNIGNIYDITKRYGKALQYLFAALKMNEEDGNEKELARSYYSLGNALANHYNYYLGCRFLHYSEIQARATGQDNLVAESELSLGNLYIDIVEKNLPPHSLIAEAKQNTDPIADKIENELKDYIAAKMVVDSIREVDLKLPKTRDGLLEEGIKLSKLALVTFSEVENRTQSQNAYQTLSIAYKLKGDWKNALIATDSFLSIRDSVLSKDNKLVMANLATTREEELKEKQIAINKLEKEKKKDERFLFGFGIAGMLLIVVTLLFNLRFVRKSHKEIEREKEISEQLLLNILPAGIAGELKSKGSSEARLFENVTVLFTDFVGFTKVSERLTPQQLVAELDTCFKAFDGIVTHYGIEKIKTIGDAYLAVCGIPNADANHAKKAVLAAKEMAAFIKSRHAILGDDTFEVRIGLHTGAVVAGIVGVKKFAYDIWGDTVNTAARMEQNSLPGRINISETTYQVIKDEIACEYRGEISAKNKGLLKMYFVA